MRDPLGLIAVAAGGAAGSLARYLVSLWFLERAGPGFPWGTFAINLTGSFAIGIVLQLALHRQGFEPHVRLLLATGFLGGFTTFSAFSYETLALVSQGFYVRGAAYAAGSVAFGFIAAYLGVVAARTLA